MTDFSRRDVLAATAATGLAGLAGCIDDIVEATDSSDPEDDPGDDGGATGDGDTDPDGSDDITVLDVTVETVGSNCLENDDDDITVEVLDDVVEVAGSISAPNPCHEVVVDTDVAEGTLSVDVGVELDDEEKDCIQCVGSLEYEATVELSGDDIETVDVSHGDDGAQATVDADETPEPEPEPRLDGVETVETACRTENETADARVEGDTLTVDGIVETSDPCHEATVTDVALEGDELTVAVDVEAQDGMCQQCLGEVHYEATIDLDGAELGHVFVDHQTGSRHTVDLE